LFFSFVYELIRLTVWQNKNIDEFIQECIEIHDTKEYFLREIEKSDNLESLHFLTGLLAIQYGYFPYNEHQLIIKKFQEQIEKKNNSN